MERKQCALLTSDLVRHSVKTTTFPCACARVGPENPCRELRSRSVAAATPFKDFCSVCMVSVTVTKQKLKKVRRHPSLEMAKRHSAVEVCRSATSISFERPPATSPEWSHSPAPSHTEPHRGCTSVEHDMLSKVTAWHQNIPVLKSSENYTQRRLTN